MRSISIRFVLGACAITTALWPKIGAAQLLDNILIPGRLVDVLPPTVGQADETVLNRARPAYDAPGVRVGNFIIRPQVTEGLLYDSNPLGTKGGRGSPAEDTQASLQIVSDFNRNGIAINLSVDDLRYFGSNQAIENQTSRTNWQGGVGGFYEVGRGRILADYSHAEQTEQRTDIGFINRNVQLPYSVDIGRLAYRTAPGGLSFEPNVSVTAYRYGVASAVPGEIPGQFQDRNVLQAGLITRYEVGERRDLVLSVEGASGNYLQKQAGLPGLDYSGVTMLAGIDYGLPAFYRLRLLGGVQTRQFSSGFYKGRTVPVGEAEVVWAPTRLTTVTGTATRRIEDSADEASQGFTYTRGRVVVDHELLRNVLLQAYGQLEYADYLQNGRTESVETVSGSSTWLLDRHLKMSASYTFERYTSNQAAAFNRSVALLQFTFGL